MSRLSYCPSLNSLRYYIGTHYPATDDEGRNIVEERIRWTSTIQGYDSYHWYWKLPIGDGDHETLCLYLPHPDLVEIEAELLAEGLLTFYEVKDAFPWQNQTGTTTEQRTREIRTLTGYIDGEQIVDRVRSRVKSTEIDPETGDEVEVTRTVWTDVPRVDDDGDPVYEQIPQYDTSDEQYEAEVPVFEPVEPVAEVATLWDRFVPAHVTRDPETDEVLSSRQVPHKFGASMMVPMERAA